MIAACCMLALAGLALAGLALAGLALAGLALALAKLPFHSISSISPIIIYYQSASTPTTPCTLPLPLPPSDFALSE